MTIAVVRNKSTPQQMGDGSSRRRRISLRIIIAVLFVAGFAQLGVRALNVPLAVDEAESAINGFSILERGYPGDRHLGQPIFENMLVRPWPGNEEYEFRDISYSDSGFAVYHGWLPLYAIAASFRLFAIEPPTPEPGWQIDIDVARFKWRTLAARAPSLLFGALFLGVLYATTRRLAGQDAALAVLVVAGQADSIITSIVYARYYALGLLLSAIAWFTLHELLVRKSWRSYLVHAGVLVAIFYTNILLLVTLVILTTAAILFFDRTWSSCRRWAAALSLVVASAAPWLVATGFIPHLQYIPSGRPLLHFPNDLLVYAFDRVPYLTIFCASVVWAAWISATSRHRARAGTDELWQRHGIQYALLVIWMAVAGALWFFAMPPASLFPQRLSLSLFLPGLLLVATTVAAASRMMTASGSVFLAPAAAYLFLLAGGLVHFPPPGGSQFERLGSTFALLNRLDLRPDAKVYASPGTHLVLSFYSDKPIQSLAPVRKTFLDSYPGEVVYLERQLEWEFAAPSSRDLKASASRLGESLDDQTASRWESQLLTRFAREQTESLVAALDPPLETLPAFAEAAMQATRARAWSWAEEERARWDHVPFSRSFNVRSGADIWQVFFYRLVNPDSRRGSGLNAADRLKQGKAYFLPLADRVLFYSPEPLPLQ